jgi:hypothetical protein
MAEPSPGGKHDPVVRFQFFHYPSIAFCVSIHAAASKTKKIAPLGMLPSDPPAELRSNTRHEGVPDFRIRRKQNYLDGPALISGFLGLKPS